MVRIFFLKPDQGRTRRRRLCKNFFYTGTKQKSLPVLPVTYQHRTFPSSSKVHHLLTPQSQPNPESSSHADDDDDNGNDDENDECHDNDADDADDADEGEYGDDECGTASGLRNMIMMMMMMMMKYIQR